MTVLAHAQPYAADGGPVGVLIAPGFTSTTASVRPWAEGLAAHGCTVRVPRLPGHGTTWQEANQSRFDDWYAEVDRALTELRTGCDRVAVGGLSMGGCLALRLAELRPDDVHAVLLVNPSIRSSNKQLLALPLLHRVVPSTPAIAGDIKKPGVTEPAYDRTPLRALYSLTRAWKVVQADLAKVTAPLLMFRSREDHVVDPSSGRQIMAEVGSAVRREIVLENSYHVATLDGDADLIASESAAFVTQHVGTTEGHDAG